MPTLHERARCLAGASVALVVVLASAIALSCAEDAAPGPAPVITAPTRQAPPASSAAAGDDDAAPPSPPPIDVAGFVVDAQEEPVLGRPITIVDQRGRRQDVLTDEGGSFHVEAVAAPYDVLVAPAPSGAIVTPLVYLGVRRPDPRLEVFESEGPVPSASSQSLHLRVDLPPCPAVSGPCWVHVVSASPSGGGATATTYAEGTASVLLDIEHSWRVADVPHDETLEVHVLVGDAACDRFAYGRVGGVAARPNENTDVGTSVAAPVESTLPLTLAAGTRAWPVDGAWTTYSELAMPGGASIALRYDSSASLPLRLPQIIGASWRASTWVQSAPAADDAAFYQSSNAWSGLLPLSARDVAMPVPPPPRLVQPVRSGSLSRRGSGFAWSPSSPGLAELLVVDLASDQQLVRAFTAATTLPLERLAALGLPLLPLGRHTLDLTTTPGPDVDALTNPDGEERRARFDTDHPGASTFERVRFLVTP